MDEIDAAALEPELTNLIVLLASSLATEYAVRPRGILVSGPGAAPETFVRRALRQLPDVQVTWLSIAELIGRSLSDRHLDSYFKRDYTNGVARILCVRELHLLSAEAARNVCIRLRDNILAMPSDWPMAVVGVTSARRHVPAALLAKGCLDHFHDILAPSMSQRLTIIQCLLPSMSQRDLDVMAHATAGLGHDELISLVMASARGCHGEVTFTALTQELSRARMHKALWMARPPKGNGASLADIGGYSDVIREVKELITWPITRGEMYRRLGVAAPSGVLLHGPPGCGKTLLVQAVANEYALNMVSIKGPELFSKYVGESEREVRSLFAKARDQAPCVLFFDEVDAIAQARGHCDDNTGSGERLLAQLLNEMDGIQSSSGVLVVGCTNRPVNELDPAMLRPGRLERRIHVRLPNAEDRADIIALLSKGTRIHEDVALTALINATEGKSGAGLAALFRRAAILALDESEHADCVQQRHFDAEL